ncbi:tRNA(Ile2) 2-agmatinylcytidine synthetase TiaS [Frankliniella fusca]|uniref:tRNA(Ile2) 2-agmatinylcytidine synthetase TiaS n=1 Tax=Frankliniella fusca TaxID=407009 RepID=A0AAE1LJV7_9NEOP|nr:tRNA(Ile2) 2-agmatinylcytidine synthetase TiaS [Frankliniella fusca]
MCGHINSFYTHIKQDLPHLLLFKCVCHTIDKCAQHAFSSLPQEVGDLINDTNMLFAHSALRWDEYNTYFKAMRDGMEPKKLIPLSKTRWLVWVPAAENIYDQWYELKGFFTMKASNPKGNERAVALTKLYNSSTLLYISFLKNVLMPVQKVSKAFEQTNADITKVYMELRTVAMTLAARILKPQCMAQAARPGMLRSEEAKVIENALNNSANLLPVDRIILGDAFTRTAHVEKLTPEELEPIRHKCGAYIFTLTKLLMSKLPDNLDAVSKLRFLTPRMVLAPTARPTFQQLPLELGVNINRDELESQWAQLGTLPITEIMDLDTETNKLEDVDIVHFWASVLKLKNACGEAAFEKLVTFALSALSLPISNAVVERAFSVMSCIKCRRRNRLQLIMLEALMRLRIHLKVKETACGAVIGQCCKTFQLSREMLRNFTSDMYRTESRRRPGYQEDADLDPDDPEEMVLCEEEREDLEEIDYEIVSMLDATNFDENLLVINLQ